LATVSAAYYRSPEYPRPAAEVTRRRASTFLAFTVEGGSWPAACLAAGNVAMSGKRQTIRPHQTKSACTACSCWRVVAKTVANLFNTEFITETRPFL
jgi:hypothetical protein